MEVETRGIGRVIFIFSNLSPKLLSILPDILAEFAEEVLNEVIKRAPVFRGTLASSLTMEIDKEGLVARIGPTARHGPFVSFPTKPHVINASVMIGPGTFRFISLHPGTKGNPYLEDALVSAEPNLPKIIQPHVVRKITEIDRDSRGYGARID